MLLRIANNIAKALLGVIRSFHCVLPVSTAEFMKDDEIVLRKCPT